MKGCISTPVSWLRLEQLALGDAPDAEAIRAHLQACDACRACFDAIERGDAEPLPALPPRPRARAQTMPAAWRRALVTTGSALALAAAVVLVLGRRDGGSHGGEGERDRDRDRVKGMAIGFALVRDDDALLAEAGGTFRDGDRFKAVVSCAPGSRLFFDVVVWDSAGASFPLEVPVDFACGNDVPLPGAFALRDTTRANVCLVWSDAPVDRAELARTPFDAARRAMSCKLLETPPPP